jgi:uroporphyrinogen-III decarboxylase
MTNEQWEKLLKVIDGKVFKPAVAAFIIDCPWLPNWAGISILDYFANEQKWFDANMKAIKEFPNITFLPGFWSEYGMCTDPSAFGTKCIWAENEFPSPAKLPCDVRQIIDMGKPNPATDGLCPFMLKRLVTFRKQIEANGHKIRFAVARGPFNLASFLMGTTEFLMALKTQPEDTAELLEMITEFLIDWVRLQKETIDTIDGIFLLDDIIGFVGPDDYESMAKPYLKRAFAAFDAKVKMFHNDASGLVCATSLEEMGINIFNFSHNHTMTEMRGLVGPNVTLLGNIPPRDVMAAGTPDDVKASVKELLGSIPDTKRLLLSVGGGMPPAVSNENIKAFMSAAGY